MTEKPDRPKEAATSNGATKPTPIKKPDTAAKKPAAKKPAAQTTLNPQAAWPFPTGTKP